MLYNTGLEKDCDKKDNSADSCTIKGSSLNPNSRPHNTSLPIVKDNTVDYLLPGMSNNEPITKETNNEMEYFHKGPNKRASANMTKQIQKEFKDVFTGIGCFEGTFSLQVKPDSKPYQVPPQCVAYVLQTLFKEELEKLQEQDIISPFSMDETAEW